MIDQRENREPDSPSRGKSSSASTNNHKNSATNQSIKKREASARRSIFSVFFHSNKSGSKSSSTDKEPETSEGVEADSEEDEDKSSSLSDDLSVDEWSASRKLRKRVKKKTQPADNDSYVLDLNKRLENEKKHRKLKRVFSFSSKNKSTSTTEDKKKATKKDSIEEKAVEEAKDSWHSNDDYIPAITEKNNNINLEPQVKKPTSPMLREFIDSHRLKFGPQDNLRGASLVYDTSDTNSSVDSLFVPQNLNHYNLGPNDWRLLNTKSTNNFTSLSLQSSESELDLLDCPAVCSTCSDDTSCSSVELVWSRSTAATQASGSRGQSPRFAKIHSQQLSRGELLTVTAPYSRGSTSGSSSFAANIADADGEIVTTPLPQQISGRQRILQRLSIFELAKPSRAKGKRFGERKSGRRKSCEEREVEEDREAKSEKNNRSSVQWVANPLFTSDELEEVAEAPEASDTMTTNDTTATTTTTTTNTASTIVGPIGSMDKQRLRHSASHESVMRQRISQVVLPWNKRWLGYKSSTSSEMQKLKQQQKHSVEDNLDDSDTSIALDFSLSTSECDNSISVDDEFERYDRFGDGDDYLDYLDEQGDFSRRNGKRWSMRSPFRGANGNEKSRPDHNNVYLNHIANLDKRIKSNVSSIKSQLSEKISDTSKRASVLADQLLSSIKDTTKEQLFSSTVWGPRDRRASDSMPNSFISSSTSLADQSLPLTSANDKLAASEDPQKKKAELFSLIYQHQQHANGQPVITRQPVEGIKSRLFSGTNSTMQHANGSHTAQKPAVPPRPKSLDRRLTGCLLRNNNNSKSSNNMGGNFSPQEMTIQETEQLMSEQNREPKARKHSDPMAPRRRVFQLRSNTISLGDLSHLSIFNDNNDVVDDDDDVESADKTKEDEETKEPREQPKKRKFIRRRRQLAVDKNEADESEGEREFFKVEYDKFKLPRQLSASSSSVSSSSKREKSRLRSLNYWRRFRVRRSGMRGHLEHQQPRRSQSADRTTTTRGD